jgi:hypothetical protein
MSMPISRQSEQYGTDAGDSAFYANRDRTTATVYVDADVHDYLVGPGITAGLLAPRVAVETFGMPPGSHAYHEESYENAPGGQWMGDDGGGRAPLRHFNPDQGYEPSEMDERNAEGVHNDDQSGYNWGPEPHHDPGAAPGPHPDFHGDAPHPQGTPVYSPGGGYGDRPPSFNEARRLHADGGPGNATEDLNESISIYGGEAHTALAVTPAQPAAPAAPVWLGHMYAPGHRVGMPWRGTTIPGTVTHLEGTNLGVRWDDGQHSVEEPGGIRPLH